MTEIKMPVDLARAFPNYTLEIFNKVKGEAQKNYGVPDEIHIRHEVQEQMLYISTKFITAAGYMPLLKEWRSHHSYRGALLKRIGAGTGRPNEKAVNCAVFDIRYRAEPPTDLEIEDSLARVRKRRGRPLTATRRAKLRSKAEEMKHKIPTFAQQVSLWQETYGHLPLYDELKHYIKDAKDTYESAYNMLSIGRRGRVKAAPNPIKTKRVALHQASIRCAGLDEIIAKDTDAICKNIRRFVFDEKGQATLEEKEYIPPMDKTEWLGRYEQGEELNGSRIYKDLYIPVSVFKSGAYEAVDILNYKRDPRYVKTCQKYIGFRGFRCAHFDLTIKPY